MNKYYTPEIEEFHIGFEYERHQYEDGNWFKYTVEERDILDHAEKEIRVKYLDKEDIESLGFKEKSLKYYIFNEPSGKLPYWNKVILDFRWSYKDISIIGIRADDLGMEEGILFRGNIKNKSELKKLLKQLNIE